MGKTPSFLKFASIVALPRCECHEPWKPSGARSRSPASGPRRKRSCTRSSPRSPLSPATNRLTLPNCYKIIERLVSGRQLRFSPDSFVQQGSEHQNAQLPRQLVRAEFRHIYARIEIPPTCLGPATKTPKPLGRWNRKSFELRPGCGVIFGPPNLARPDSAKRYENPVRRIGTEKGLSFRESRRCRTLLKRAEEEKRRSALVDHRRNGRPSQTVASRDLNAPRPPAPANPRSGRRIRTETSRAPLRSS
jgi:hypothetical protein